MYVGGKRHEEKSFVTYNDCDPDGIHDSRM